METPICLWCDCGFHSSDVYQAHLQSTGHQDKVCSINSRGDIMQLRVYFIRDLSLTDYQRKRLQSMDVVMFEGNQSERVYVWWASDTDYGRTGRQRRHKHRTCVHPQWLDGMVDELVRHFRYRIACSKGVSFMMISGLAPKNAGFQNTKSAILPTSTRAHGLLKKDIRIGY